MNENEDSFAIILTSATTPDTTGAAKEVPSRFVVQVPSYEAATMGVTDFVSSPPGAAINTDAPGVEKGEMVPGFPTAATGMVKRVLAP